MATHSVRFSPTECCLPLIFILLIVQNRKIQATWSKVYPLPKFFVGRFEFNIQSRSIRLTAVTKNDNRLSVRFTETGNNDLAVEMVDYFVYDLVATLYELRRTADRQPKSPLLIYFF